MANRILHAIPRRLHDSQIFDSNKVNNLELGCTLDVWVDLLHYRHCSNSVCGILS